MAANNALAFVREHGVVLASARGPAPRLTEAIAGEPIEGSWWAHPRGREIFRVLSAVQDSDEVLVCRLIDAKVTLVHRRLWPALVRLAGRFPAGQLARVRDVHTSSGRHAVQATPFPRWVPEDVANQAGAMSEKEAEVALGNFAAAGRS